MSSQASAEPLRASTRAQASNLHDRTSLAIVLPIDAIFAPPLQDRPRRSIRDPQIPIGRTLQRALSRPGFLLVNRARRRSAHTSKINNLHVGQSDRNRAKTAYTRRT
jgi:hypothetical protein